MKFSFMQRAGVAAAVGALLFTGCSTTDVAVDEKEAEAKFAVEAATSYNEYLADLREDVEPLLAADFNASETTQPEVLDTYFADTMGHLAIDTFASEKHARAATAVNYGVLMVAAAFTGLTNVDDALADVLAQMEVSPDDVSVDRDVATIDLPDVPWYTNEDGSPLERSETLIRDGDTWKIDGRTYDKAWFNDLGMTPGEVLGN